jgi:hypothetical protein
MFIGQMQVFALAGRRVKLRLSDSEAMVPEAYGTGCSGLLSEPWLRRPLGERGDPQSSNHVQERRRTTATAEARLHGLADEHRHQDEG